MEIHLLFILLLRVHIFFFLTCWLLLFIYIFFGWCLYHNRAAATALAKRHADGSLPIEDFNIELEDQSGKTVHLGSETDQRYDK